MSTFFIPSINVIGTKTLDEALIYIKGYGFKKALIVTDRFLGSDASGMAKKIAEVIKTIEIDSVIFDGAQPNPTIKNVEDGLKVLKEANCDCVISLGGGSSHDCAKGIALVATNGGEIEDYEGLDQSLHPQLPLIAINTTAGTASEMTRFCIITDEDRQVKMAIVDKHVTAILSINDAALMVGKPKALTAATGIDALTHSIEAFVSTGANPITDACAIQAMKLISQNLKRAYDDGENIEARENMAYAQFLAGMAFNNASLGYVHAIAHQLGGYYDLAHGECNAVLLPHVQAFNAQVAAGRLKECASYLGEDVANLTDEEGAKACIEAIKKLSASVDIPSGIRDLKSPTGKIAKKEDFDILAENALKDVCGFSNPIPASQADIIKILEAAF
ncbi:MAG: L-threonine dehydrogenase [Defluviitaleaceae bacterium]|nr:L-threonine dehydrogenase [Defluviitaleaceae bacterium]